MSLIRYVGDSIFWTSRFKKDFSWLSRRITPHRDDFWFDWAVPFLMETEAYHAQNRRPNYPPREFAHIAYLNFIVEYFSRGKEDQGAWVDVLACTQAFENTFFVDRNGQSYFGKNVWEYQGLPYLIKKARVDLLRKIEISKGINWDEVKARASDMTDDFDAFESINIEVDGFLDAANKGLDCIEISEKLSISLVLTLSILEFLRGQGVASRRWSFQNFIPCYSISPSFEWADNLFDVSRDL